MYRESIANSDIHPVIIASIFHHRFTSIHPFDDGNGRMSRLLMNLILMQHDYPPVVIKDSEKNNYYLVLSQADTGNVEPFVNFISANLIDSLNLYIRGAKGESIEEQSDLKKKLLLFKKEVEARRDRIELKKSPEVVKNTFNKSIIPFIGELNIVLSDFKELFFEQKEKHVYPISFPRSGWQYQDISLFEYLESIITEEQEVSVIVISFQFSDFKLAEDSFSVELKLAIMLNDLDYSVHYSFSEKDELERATASFYNQWLTSSIGRRYYHQYLTIEEIKKLTNKIGEEFYDYNRIMFDKTKKYEPDLSNEEIMNMWDSFTNTYEKLDQSRLAQIYNDSVLEVSLVDDLVTIRVGIHTFSTIRIEERIDLESSFSKLVNKEAASIKKIFVRMIGPA